LKERRKGSCFTRDADQRTAEAIAHLNEQQRRKDRPPVPEYLYHGLPRAIRLFAERCVINPCSKSSLARQNS
jgi:hypothetical protein